MSFVKAFVKNINTSISEDLHFSLTPSQIPRQVAADEDKHSDRVRLPGSLFETLQGNQSVIRLAVMVLDIGHGNLFKGPQFSQEDGRSVLNNRLVGLSLGGTPVTRLAEPLKMTFFHQLQPPNVTLSCVFWDVTKGSTGDWSSKGCSTELRATGTVCRCDHLTFFALLMRPILDQATVKALIRISQAGCGASMIFLAFTIVLYAILRFSWQRFKSEDAPKIHVALSISLFLLNLAFFINVGQGSNWSDATCWARGAVFHYFLLCVFTWMGLEAFHLYLLIIKVFNTYFGHYFLKLSLVGWGLPALMVIGTGSANSYGRYAIRDKKNITTLELCWFREKTAVSALYVTVHGYFLITFLFNAVVLGLVAWNICTLSSSTAGKEQGQNWKGVFTVLGLSCLVSSSSAGLLCSTSPAGAPCPPLLALPELTRHTLCLVNRGLPCGQAGASPTLWSVLTCCVTLGGSLPPSGFPWLFSVSGEGGDGDQVRPSGLKELIQIHRWVQESTNPGLQESKVPVILRSPPAHSDALTPAFTAQQPASAVAHLLVSLRACAHVVEFLAGSAP
ncbi:adhesion G protein-coupled receptor G3 isoform X3 [Manis javanica]